MNIEGICFVVCWGRVEPGLEDVAIVPAYVTPERSLCQERSIQSIIPTIDF